MTKNEYIQELVKAHVWNLKTFKVALIFWHSEIPLEDAKKYMTNILRKTQHMQEI